MVCSFYEYKKTNYLYMKLKIFLILFSPALFFSCMTPPKNITYFQDLEMYRQNADGNNLLSYEPVIKKFDELMITLTAPVLEQVTVAQFNPPMTTFLSVGDAGLTNIQQSPSIQTYIVDHDGAINYPVIGKIHLAGLTKSQAIENIKKLVSPHVEDPIITMRIMSFSVTVLGEVMKPGNVPVKQEKMSILDAIGHAGDLTIHGSRENVLVIRENDNGVTDFHRFDLTKSDIFSSPYYYVQQNDKIVVEPNKTRQLESKYGVADGYKLSVFSMVFSAVSIIASTTIAIISLNK